MLHSSGMVHKKLHVLPIFSIWHRLLGGSAEIFHMVIFHSSVSKIYGG